MTEEEDVVVLQSMDPVELELARNLLAEAGIPCSVSSGSAGDYLKAVLGTSIPGPAEVRVPADFVERALEVFDEAWGEQDEEDRPPQ
jgi:hypothetical protein